MPYIILEDQTRLYYETHGSGTPILFIHGVLMSGQFFHKQFSVLSANYQLFVLILEDTANLTKCFTATPFPNMPVT